MGRLRRANGADEDRVAVHRDRSGRDAIHCVRSGRDAIHCVRSGRDAIHCVRSGRDAIHCVRQLRSQQVATLPCAAFESYQEDHLRPRRDAPRRRRRHQGPTDHPMYQFMSCVLSSLCFDFIVTAEGIIANLPMPSDSQRRHVRALVRPVRVTLALVRRQGPDRIRLASAKLADVFRLLAALVERMRALE